LARRIPAHRHACGSAFCRAPPASGTIHWCGFLRRNAGSPAAQDELADVADQIENELNNREYIATQEELRIIDAAMAAVDSG
jgi:hypothetical protein